MKYFWWRIRIIYWLIKYNFFYFYRIINAYKHSDSYFDFYANDYSPKETILEDIYYL